MDTQLKKGLLELCVMARLLRSESYGYQIIKDLTEWIEISESTLYPILRRLEAGGEVEVYSAEYHNRIRKYYKITDKGRERLREFNEEQWKLQKILNYIEGQEEGKCAAF